MQIILAIHKPQDIDPTRAPGRQFDDALGLLPGIGNRGIQRQSSFIKIIETQLALVLEFLQGGTFPLTAGKGLRIAETLSRLAHPFPSKTCLCGQPFARRETEALLGCVGEALRHPFERTGLFLDILLGECLFVGGEFGGSATARLIMQTLGAMVFPLRDPGRHGDAMHLIGIGNGLDGCAGSTQQQTVGAAPRSECRVLFHGLFSECTLLVAQRLHISHDHHLIRSWGIHHEKRFDVDEVLYQHCVKKLLVGYLLPKFGPN